MASPNDDEWHDKDDSRTRFTDYGNTADPQGYGDMPSKAVPQVYAETGDPALPWKIPVSQYLGDNQHRPQAAPTSGIPSKPAPPQSTSQAPEDDGSSTDVHSSAEHPFAGVMPQMGMPPMGMPPMGMPQMGMPPMPMSSHEYAAIAQQWAGLAHQAQYMEEVHGGGGFAPSMPPNFNMFPPGMPGMPGIPWAPPFAGCGSMPPGANPHGYQKGGQKGKKYDKTIYNVGQGRGQGGKNAAMQQQAAASGQLASGNQNNAPPIGASGPKALTWSAKVLEKHKNERTYVDGIIFHAALDRKLLQSDIGTDSDQNSREETSKIGTDTWMKYYSSMKDLDLDKLTPQDGREMTYEEYCQLRETSKKTQSKSAPEGSLSKEQQQAKLKVRGSGEKPVELSFEDVTLLRCQLRMKDGTEMSLPKFLALTDNERKARLPVQVKVPECGKQALKTTVMIRNLPNKYERDDVRDLLDYKGFKGRYDFVYVPADYKHHTGLGYAFVNMGNKDPDKTENEVFHNWAVEVWEALDGFTDWKLIDGKKSSKECEVTWGSSEHQGKQHHIDRYKNSPVMHADNKSSYKPAIYDVAGNMVEFPVSTKALRKPRTKKQPRTGCTSPRSSKAEDEGKGTDAGSGGGPGDEQT